MKLNTEADVKRALGIESFRNLSKDAVMKFAVLMPDVDRDVRMKIIEQFPHFKDFAVGATRAIESTHRRAMDSNDVSQQQVAQAWTEVRAILREQLATNELTWEQRAHLIDLIVETAEKQSLKDSENKRFIETALKWVGAGVGAVALVAVGALGARVVGQDSGSVGGGNAPLT